MNESWAYPNRVCTYCVLNNKQADALPEAVFVGTRPDLIQMFLCFECYKEHRKEFVEVATWPEFFLGVLQRIAAEEAAARLDGSYE